MAKVKLSEWSKGKVDGLLLGAVKMAGTYDPDEVLVYIEESLTGEEFDASHAFLKWVQDNGREFGRGNFWDIWAQWERDSGE